jgi:hypothetical protein
VAGLALWLLVLEMCSLVVDGNLHPTGFAWGEANACGSCAWSMLRGPGTKKLRCVRAEYQRVETDLRSCQFWETELDCLKCGACCSEAYDAVEVSRTDPVRKKQPDWIVKVDGRYQMRRKLNNTCGALGKDLYCAIYTDRPLCCRGFEQGSANCLFARRRLKISS